jgi:hypothetical protein
MNANVSILGGEVLDFPLSLSLKLFNQARGLKF